MQDPVATLELRTENDTARLAESLAIALASGDTILLFGDLGAGKSFFARCFIRQLLGPETEVPSPTFTLVQTYQAPDFEIWHCDLYRLTDETEAIELGLDDALKSAVCLIEWPERLGPFAPTDAIELHLMHQENGRRVEIRGSNPRLLKALDFYE